MGILFAPSMAFSLCASSASAQAVTPATLIAVAEGIKKAYDTYQQIQTSIHGSGPTTAQLIASAKDEIISEIQNNVTQDLKNQVETSIRSWAEISESLALPGDHTIMMQRISTLLENSNMAWVSLKNQIDHADPNKESDRVMVYQLAVAFNAVAAVRLDVFTAMQRMDPPMPVAQSSIDTIIEETLQTNYAMVGYGVVFTSDPYASTTSAAIRNPVRNKILYEKFHATDRFASSQRTCTIVCGASRNGTNQWCDFHEERHTFAGDNSLTQCSFLPECTRGNFLQDWVAIAYEEDDCKALRDDEVNLIMAGDPVVSTVRAAMSSAVALGRAKSPVMTSYYEAWDSFYAAGAPVFLGGVGRGLSLNHDAFSDLLFVDPSTHSLWANTSIGSGFFGPFTQQWIAAGTFGSDPRNYFPGDFNGDDKVDLGYFEPSDRSFHVVTGTGSSFWGPGTGRWIDPGQWSARSSGRLFACDFSGDGADDLGFFDVSDNSFQVTISSGTGFGASGSGQWIAPNDFGHGAGTHFAGDFNGDRKCDLGFFEPRDNTFHVTLSTGSGFGGSGSGVWVSSNAFGHWGGNYYVGDFNGDGRDDLGFFEPSNDTFHVTLSGGMGFLGGSEWVAPGDFGSHGDKYLVADYNGDGIEDLGYQETADDSFFVDISTGAAFGGYGTGRWIEPESWGDYNGRFMAVRNRAGSTLECEGADCQSVQTFDSDGSSRPWVYSDWAVGEFKGQCPSGSPASGISLNATGRPHSLLCAGVLGEALQFFPPGTAGATVQSFALSNSPAFGSRGDWALGYFKGECPDGGFITGVAQDTQTGAVTKIECAQALTSLKAGPIGSCEVISTPLGQDVPASLPDGDWAGPDFSKYACDPGAVLTGIGVDAFGGSRPPFQLLCCQVGI